MEPTVFWSVYEDGRGSNSQNNGLLAEIPKVSPLTIAIRKREFSPPHGLDPDGCLVQQELTLLKRKSRQWQRQDNDKTHEPNKQCIQGLSLQENYRTLAIGNHFSLDKGLLMGALHLRRCGP